MSVSDQKIMVPIYGKTVRSIRQDNPKSTSGPRVQFHVNEWQEIVYSGIWDEEQCIIS